MEKPYELTEEAWLHFVMSNRGRSEEEMGTALNQLVIYIAQMELAMYMQAGGWLH